MSTVHFIGLFVLNCLPICTFAESTDPIRNSVHILVENANLCAPACNNYINICIPQWADPANYFRVHCEDNPNVAQASDSCVICLTKDHDKRPEPNPAKPTISDAVVQQCAPICNYYNEVCLPEWVDPDNFFGIHCEVPPKKPRVSTPCLLCLKNQGQPPNGKPNPGPIGCSNCMDPCYSVCGNYNNMCIPPILDREGIFPHHCKSENDPEHPSTWCFYCFVKNGIPDTLKTTPSPQITTTTAHPTTSLAPPTPKEDMILFCAPVCDFYNNVCMPKWLDPEKYFINHCEEKSNMRRATVVCVLCLMQTVTLPPPSTDAGQSFCVNCVDPCEYVCSSYKDMCLPAVFDSEGFFKPHCPVVSHYVHPSMWCFCCLVKHGLPDRFKQPQITSTWTAVQNTVPPWTFTPNPSYGSYDVCAPVCNFMNACPPQWGGLLSFFRPSCDNYGGVKPTAILCTLCRQQNGGIPIPTVNYQVAKPAWCSYTTPWINFGC